jgi:predicted aconitase
VRCGIIKKGDDWYETYSSKGMDFVILGCPSCRVVRKGRIACLLVKKNRRVKVEVSQTGYSSCIHLLKPQQKTFRWKLKLETTDFMDDSDYRCTRP